MSTPLEDPTKKAALEKFREPSYVLLFVGFILFTEAFLNWQLKSSLLDIYYKSPTELPVGSFLILVVLYAFARRCTIWLLPFIREVEYHTQWLTRLRERTDSALISRKDLLSTDPDALVWEDVLERDAIEEKNTVIMQVVQRKRDWFKACYEIKEECFWVGVILFAGYLSPHHFVHHLVSSWDAGPNAPAGLAHILINLTTVLTSLVLILKAVPYVDDLGDIYLPGNTVNQRDRERRANARRASRDDQGKPPSQAI